MTGDLHIRRLSAGDGSLAAAMFAMMAAVFGEDADTLSSDYVARLLRRDDFWAIAALDDGQPIAGLTAFVLPLTRAESAELFIYDIAVQPRYRRRGIGRRLVAAARDLAAGAGIATIFVPAENDDAEALEFYRAIGGAPTPATFFTFSQ
jgi:aminoglycoside 3-N-acetyltransferase I